MEINEYYIKRYINKFVHMALECNNLKFLKELLIIDNDIFSSINDILCHSKTLSKVRDYEILELVFSNIKFDNSDLSKSIIYFYMQDNLIVGNIDNIRFLLDKYPQLDINYSQILNYMLFNNVINYRFVELLIDYNMDVSKIINENRLNTELIEFLKCYSY